MLFVNNTSVSNRHTKALGGVMEKKVGLPCNGESSGDHALNEMKAALYVEVYSEPLSI